MSERMELHQISNGSITARVSPYGATLQALYLDGHRHSLVLGSDNLELYRGDLRYAGAVIGPVANRIAEGTFSLDGQTYDVDKNFLEKHCLHSGRFSTADRVWAVDELTNSSVRFQLRLDNLESGFPGPMQVFAEYRIDSNGLLELQIDVTSARVIAANWAHHCYFNLDGSGQLTDHWLQVFADAYLPVDAELIPTGEIRAAGGGPFDLRQPKRLGQAQFDHNFCTADSRSDQLRLQAELYSSASGIRLRIESTEPGLQVYTGDHLRSGGSHMAGIALEPQGWPNALNQPNFPSIVLRSNQHYRQIVRYSISD